MTTNQYIRFRQVCVATLDLEQDVTLFTKILGVAPCHRSRLDHFGLENAMFAIGGSFIELVAPTQDQTAVHRFLKRSQGLGGYMAIFDCDDVLRQRSLAQSQNISIVFERSTSAADLLQLSPRDTGVTMLEFDHHTGGEDRLQAYEWAGSDWQKHLNPDLDITEITMTCADPDHIRSRWKPLFPSSVQSGPNTIELTHGTIRFTKDAQSTHDYFSAARLKTDHPELYLERAENAGLDIGGRKFSLCGVDWVFAQQT